MQLPNCEVCGKSVAEKEGILSISFRDVREVQEGEREWRKVHPGPILTPKDLMSLPSSVRWVWHHASCSIDGASYEIEGESLDTHEKALHWTIHLMEKKWFHFTDWRGVIEKFYPECS